jgi:hypothetical protein
MIPKIRLLENIDKRLAAQMSSAILSGDCDTWDLSDVLSLSSETIAHQCWNGFMSCSEARMRKGLEVGHALSFGASTQRHGLSGYKTFLSSL